MSGGNGPDLPVIGGVGGVADCAGLRKRAALQAPNPDVVADLAVDDVLALVLHDGDAPVIAVVTDRGEEAGAVMPERQLIECLRLNVAIFARVISVDGGHILLLLHST